MLHEVAACKRLDKRRLVISSHYGTERDTTTRDCIVCLEITSLINFAYGGEFSPCRYNCYCLVKMNFI